jgi:zinc ribbon protein
MTDVVFCGNCGREIAATAKFCKHCGADQTPFQDVGDSASTPADPDATPADPDATQVDQPVPPADQAAEAPTQPLQPPSPPPAAPPPSEPTASASERAEQVAPGATELAEQLAAHLRTPGVALAGLSALIGVGVCLGVGLILAILLPNASFLAVGGGSGLFKETLIQAVSFSQANLELVETGYLEGTVRTVPVLFALIPILGVAVGVTALASRTAEMPARERLLWAAGAGIPFAVAMLVIALCIGKASFDLFPAEVEVSSGSVFLLSLLWGALGGVLGMLFALRQTSGSMPELLPAGLARYAGIAWTSLRPLLLALLVVGVLGTFVWVVQVMREDGYRDFPERSTAVAVAEQIAYAGDHAVDILPLGAGASQRFTGAYPAVPVDQEAYAELAGDYDEDTTPTYNIFDFSDTMPAYLFLPMLIVLIAIPGLLALYAGFAVARRLGETRMERAAAWGAIVGPVWAIAMVLLTTLARKGIVGDPTGDSVFVAFLVGGAALGALGGLLAAQGSSPQTGATPPPSASSPPADPIA